jgi:hypothetical protein
VHAFIGEQEFQSSSDNHSFCLIVAWAAGRPGPRLRSSAARRLYNGYFQRCPHGPVKGIEPSSSAWKGDAVSMISEVIPDNRYQKYRSGINQKLPRREQANGPMSDAIHLPAFENISTIGR